MHTHTHTHTHRVYIPRVYIVYIAAAYIVYIALVAAICEVGLVLAHIHAPYTPLIALVATICERLCRHVPQFTCFTSTNTSPAGRRRGV